MGKIIIHGQDHHGGSGQDRNSWLLNGGQTHSQTKRTSRTRPASTARALPDPNHRNRLEEIRDKLRQDRRSPIRRLAELFRYGSARTTLRCDASNAAGTYLVSNSGCIGGRGVQESWIRRQVWNAGRGNGWLCCGHRGAHLMRRRREHRVAGIAITLSKPAAHADSVPADRHEVGCAP